MQSKSRVSEKLQEMQIICANQLHDEKEDRKESIRKQQEEGGESEITGVGAPAEWTKCNIIINAVVHTR